MLRHDHPHALPVIAARPRCGQPAGSLTARAQRVKVLTLTALGRAMSFDVGLSASGHVVRASCHDTARA